MGCARGPARGRLGRAPSGCSGTGWEADRPMARDRQRPRIGAAIDIGSYSVHLLVAEQQGKRLIELHDESAFLGLGRTIDADGQLGRGAAQLIDTLATYAQRARDQGAPT